MKIMEQMWSLEGIEILSDFSNLILLLLCLALLWIGKKVFDFLTPYNLEEQLVKVDNKAISVAFVGYLSSLAIVMTAVVKGAPSHLLGNSSDSMRPEVFELLNNAVDITLWGVIGILLLNLSGWINDKLILRYFDNNKELVQDRNVGTGAVVAGSYLGSSFLIYSILIGETSEGLFWDIGLTLGYFFIAQIAFFLFSVLYQALVGYDLHAEIEKDNIAAGISFGMNLAAIGLLISAPIRQSYSILLLIAWFVVGAAIMAMTRFLLDRLIIPSENLDSEIHRDKNWGIALLEGCFSLIAVLILTQIFSPQV